MNVTYVINGVPYKKLNKEQRRKITDKLAEAFGIDKFKVSEQEKEAILAKYKNKSTICDRG